MVGGWVAGVCRQGFVQERMFGACVAFSLLYFTVLSDHHPLSTAWLASHVVPVRYIGLMRMAGAGAGLGGAVIFPLLVQKGGGGGDLLVAGAVASHWLLFLTLLPVVFLVRSVEEDEGAGGLAGMAIMVLIVVSRFWLYGIDVANNQMLLELVSNENCAKVTATQASIAQSWELILAALALIISVTHTHTSTTPSSTPSAGATNVSVTDVLPATGSMHVADAFVVGTNAPAHYTNSSGDVASVTLSARVSSFFLLSLASVSALGVRFLHLPAIRYAFKN